MLLFENEKAQAVYFMGKGAVVREMLYSEFEAILDGVVPANEWADREALAIYLEINQDLLITAAVFFRVTFDSAGAVLPSWRLPLEDLAKHASKGPNLGAGPITLACAAQSPIDYFASELWNPDMKPGNSHFALLKKVVKRNRLGFQFKPLPEGSSGKKKQDDGQLKSLLEQKISQQLRRQFEKSFRNHMAQLLKEQRLRVTTLTAAKDKVLEDLKRKHNQRMEQVRNQLAEKDRRLAEVEGRNAQLKETIDGQADKIQGLREYFEHKLEKMQGEESHVVTALKENYAMELEAKIAAATTSLKETLQMREVEILYRNEQEAQLHDEISRLRQKNKELLDNSGGQLLEKLSRKGVNFVTFQPGAGHVTVPVSEIAEFIDNPVQFAAKHCGVSLQQYRAWLDHYQTPVCQAKSAAGSCNATVVKVASPADFHPGESDICDTCRQKPQTGTIQLVRS